MFFRPYKKIYFSSYLTGNLRLNSLKNRLNVVCIGVKCFEMYLMQKKMYVQGTVWYQKCFCNIAK